MSWERFEQFCVEFTDLDFAIDVSRVDFSDGFLSSLKPSLDKAFEAMAELEAGAIANPDEKRMVGHYWLRSPELAPEPELREAIQSTLSEVYDFTGKVHRGEIEGSGGSFEQVLVIGIGGSALGPQFVANALGDQRSDKLAPYFFDNTDPDGIDRTLLALEGKLDRTLAVVISKSGSTPETRNGMLEAKAAWERAGLDFGKHAVAVTGVGSKLDQEALEKGWITRFPMWDWVGGRTSEMAAVGLLPAALQGLDIEAMLAGAAEMDAVTRARDLMKNPAALLAASWLFLTNGKGEKDMVVLPYKDRLELFSKYLQQLVMESLGKETDLDGALVHQGIAVYGNKGSTDQHAYVQQLREGVPNFFAVFIEVLRDREGAGMEVEPGITTGNFLQGFFLGTRDALYENGRQSITLTVEQVDARTVGRLIALFERAVGFYASLVNINAYHQPGVEAGKKAAAAVLALQQRVVDYLRQQKGKAVTAPAIAQALGEANAERIYKILRHLAASPGAKMVRKPADQPTGSGFLYQD